jgi:hypothetical protein
MRGSGGGTAEGNSGIEGPRLVEQSRRDEVLPATREVHDVQCRQSGAAASKMAVGRKGHNRRATRTLRALSAEAE